MRLTLAMLALALSACAVAQPASVNLDGLPSDLRVLSRGDWGAATPTLPMTSHLPAVITIHHTATPANPDRSNGDKIRGLQAFSQRADTLGDGRLKAAWPDVPYHYYIAYDGVIIEGRDIRFEGDTNTRYDLTGHIQIVVEGNFEESEPTDAQLTSLTRLVVSLAEQWDVPPEAIAGHGDQAMGQTLCPGEELADVLPVLRAAVAAAR